MPAILPYSTRRRKGPTPIAYHSIEDGHERAFEIYGLLKLNSRQTIAPNNTQDQRNPEKSNTGMSTVEEDKTVASRKVIELTDLPEEIQKQIFSFARNADLIALSLVSRRIRDIAAAVLYRTFHIVFPDDDDPANDYPIDSLASGLDTFVTSNYDYAVFLRRITLEALSSGIKGELAYRHYLLDASCGKFMNTLLYLTLKKARALESFTWDIRVELSREVFKALHGIKSLKNLHIRMQAGESIHMVAPPLPNSETTTSTPISPYSPSSPSLTHHNTTIFISPVPAGYPPSISTPNHKNILKSHGRGDKSHQPVIKGPPTISEFQKLKSLSILDMDSHEYLDEIKACIENSASTLETLRLSFSDYLANKSRKPAPELNSDSESDIEDEFGQIIAPPGAIVDPNAPSKALKAQEEKKNQEAALAKIFGSESVSTKSKTEGGVIENKKQKQKDDRTTKSIKSFVNFFTKFMSQVKPGREDTTEAKEAMEMIEKATRMYLDIQKKDRSKEARPTETDGTSTPSSTASKLDLEGVIGDKAGGDVEAVEEEPGLFDEPQTRPTIEPVDPAASNPEDIDIEAPEELELGIDAEIDGETNTSLSETPKADETLSSDSLGQSQPSNLNLTEKEKQVLQDLDNALLKTAKSRDSNSQDWFQGAKAAIEERKKSDYIRTTRGLTLKTLAFYHMPVKTSVLTKSIDLNVLQNLTLLSVGPQEPIWNRLEKENAESPLQLKSIHTDNVTLPLLNLLSQLQHLDELYLRERKPKRGVENTTTKTNVTIEQIRKAVLRKHASSLRILVIRNDAAKDWDLDVKSVMLLCHEANKLEELTVGFSNDAMHTFLQFFHGLAALHAIHVLAFRHPDNCDFSRHELPRLIIDNVSTYPTLKLEYIAFAENVERLIRRKVSKPKEKTAKEVQARAKEKAAKKAKESLTTELFQTISMVGPSRSYDWEDSSEDEVESKYGKHGLKLETYPLRMCDVVGVRIYEKEILSSRL